MEVEYLDVLDEKGNPTGESKPKDLIHADGDYHATVHIWLFTDRGEILLQKRSAQKRSFPNLWDISVAGHVNSQETVEQAALRETFEEIGLKISTGNLKKIHVFKNFHDHGPNFKDAEFNHVFIAKLKEPLENLTLQESEITGLWLVPLDVYLEMLRNREENQLTPMEDGYLDTLIEHLLKVLEPD